MDRTQAPTESRKESLRADGIIPFSRFVLRASATVSVFIFSGFVIGRFSAQLPSMLKASHFDRSVVMAYSKLSFSSLAWITLLALAAVFLTGQVFTRFWFRVTLKTRPHQFDSQRVGVSVLRLFLGGLLVLYLSSSLVPFLWSILSVDAPEGQAVAAISSVVKFTVFVTSGFLFASAVLSYFLGKIDFSRRNKMTKREIMQE